MEIKRKLALALLGSLVCGGLVCVVTVWGRMMREDEPSSASHTGRARQGSILDVPVASFKIEDADMAEALPKLRSSDVSRIVIGFERAPYKDDQKGGPISLALADTTLGDVVQQLCQADQRYAYRVVEGSVVQSGLEGSIIEIRPKGAAKDPNDLLNLKVQHYRVDADIQADQAIAHVSEDAPELREFLHREALLWAARAGRQPGGSPGAITSGNMPPPRFTLELNDVTVVRILDALSLKSIQRFKEGKSFGPVGWEYDFVVDPKAPTGLGGRPEWKPL
jgi:hypothetical protein